MPDKWHRTFNKPVPLPDGGELRTLRDAGNYITKLPKRVTRHVRMARRD